MKNAFYKSSSNIIKNNNLPLIKPPIIKDISKKYKTILYKNEEYSNILSLFLEKSKKNLTTPEIIKQIKYFIRKSKLSKFEDLSLMFRGYLEYFYDNIDLSEKNFKESLKKNNKLSFAWNGIGRLYSIQKKYKKAIFCFKKSIKLNKQYSSPWHGLGYIYDELKYYDKSVECYENAIKLNNNFCHAWNDKGVLYEKLKKFEDAHNCYDATISINKKIPEPWYNKGNLFYKQYKYKESKKYLIEAFRLFKKNNDHYNASITKFLLDKIKSLLKAENHIQKNSITDPVISILKDTKNQNLEEDIFNNKLKITDFLEEKPENIKLFKPKYYLEILRKWNSYTPIVPENIYSSKGGGYFIKTPEKGIVIDPGFNFIDNFIKCGHKFYEIDAIFISHAHNDHTEDLESILTLLKEYNNEIMFDEIRLNTIQKDLFREKIKKNSKIKMSDIPKEEIINKFKGSARRKIIDLFINESVSKKYNGLFKLYSKNDYNVITINSNSKELLIDNIKIYVINAAHEDLLSDKCSIGFIFEIDNSIIIYTGDTGWNQKIEKQYKEIAKKYKKKNILLLAHLGGFKEEEVNYSENPDDQLSFYKNHLGRLGIGKINQILLPNICLISEFGEEFKKCRIKFTKICEKAFLNKIKFFAADIGLKYNILTKQIESISKLDLTNNIIRKNYIKPEDVLMYDFELNNSIYYYDKNGLFNEATLCKVLINSFRHN